MDNLLGEFMGTLVLIVFGCGVNANMALKKTCGNGGGCDGRSRPALRLLGRFQANSRLPPPNYRRKGTDEHCQRVLRGRLFEH